MVASPVNDAWLESALGCISIAGGSNLAFEAQTETIDIDIADKDFNGVPMINGGRRDVWVPQGDSTITLEAYPMQAGTDSGTTLNGWDDLMNSVDSSQPLRIINNRVRNRVRILVLWTNDPTMTTAAAISTATYSALRIGLADAYVTSCKKSFTDGVLKYTVVVKCSAFDTTGAGRILHESSDGSGSVVIPIIAAYTSSNKFG